jgi:hypothetical protein
LSSIRETYEKDSTLRATLGSEIAQEIRLGIEGKGDLPSRWHENEKLFQNQPQGSREDLPDASNIPIPLMEPKGSALVANTIGGMTASIPYFIARGYADVADRNDAQEKALHFAFKKANWDFYARKVGLHAFLCGKGIYQVYYQEGETKRETLVDTIVSALKKLSVIAGKLVGIAKPATYPRTRPGLCFEAVHPDAFVCYPSNVTNLADAKTTGKRFYRRRQSCEEMATTGKYFEGSVKGLSARMSVNTDGSASMGFKKNAGSEARIDEKDDDIEIWQVVTYRDLDGDGVEEPYWATIAMATETLLDLYEYDTSRTCFFDVSFQIDIAEEGFWPAGSPAYNLQGLHKLQHYLFNAYIDALEMKIWPPVFSGDFGDVDGNAVRYKKGQIIEVDPTMPPTPLGGQVDLTHFGEAIQWIRDMADESGRIPRTMMGALPQGDQTATATSLAAAGGNIGIREYYATFGIGHVPMIEFVCELLAVNFKSMKAYWGSAWPATSPADLLLAAEWEVNGKTPLMSPQSILQSALMLSQFAQDPEYGFDKWELGRAALESSSLDNNDKIQIPKEVLKGIQAEAVQQADQMMQDADAQGQEDAEQGFAGDGSDQGAPAGDPGGMVQ